MGVPSSVERIYYPKATSQEWISSDGKEQLIEYNALCDTIRSVQGLLDAQRNKNALAFLVEATRQAEPEDWKSRLKGTRERIADLRNSPSEVSWFLYRLISKLYTDSLTQRLNCAKHNPQLNQELARILLVLNAGTCLYQALHAEGQPVGLGTIPENDIPQWYLKA